MRFYREFCVETTSLQGYRSCWSVGGLRAARLKARECALLKLFVSLPRRPSEVKEPGSSVNLRYSLLFTLELFLGNFSMLFAWPLTFKACLCACNCVLDGCLRICV